ncbi:MAG: galactokinase [Verrucomicrobia bacterium]|nr:galactokinase [Verrucomicrobiota bacterium]MCG2681703.1 galactokinase [Kiritimatiellia bacterium]MBU4248518.1 galactokinase [Verrucomicrobiota bacterium]MBU4290191.1 galactokinase [Verrucomicrobiota bacterium]MBU4428231.1 galactokinase [Verrucomicrobiota bacterium]
MNLPLIEKVEQAHTQRFGAAPAIIAYAPGRVEILGNHTDYNEGFVLSAAIDLGIAMAISSAPSSACVLRAVDVNEEITVELPVKAPVEKPLWANYVLGVVNKLSGAGRIEKGFFATFAGDIPLGAGLSSSAALEVAAALGMGALANIHPSKLDLAKLCQAAENEFTGARCGLLDQISSLYGEPESLVFTDFRSLEVESVPLGADVCFLVANTRVKHSLVESEYNERRAQCEQAAAFFASTLNHPVKALRDVSVEEWKRWASRMDPVTARRAAHIVEENYRVLEARRLLAAGNLKGFGELMFQSHHSSRVNFENSCRELDALADAARNLPAVLGARLSGGGFGGSVVLMVHPAEAAAVGREITELYRAVFGHPCDVRVVKPSAGARLV